VAEEALVSLLAEAMSFVCFFDAWFGAVHNILALGCVVSLYLFAYMVAVLSSLFGALVLVKTDLDSTRFRS
jgi:hypothetical protein